MKLEDYYSLLMKSANVNPNNSIYPIKKGDFMTHWYEDKNNLIELGEFLVESEEIITAKDMLEYFKNPEKYTDVWKTYQEEVLGKPPNPGSMCIYKHVPTLVSLVHPSSQCQ